MLPRVSVVLPFRNAERWLPETLASLARQEGVEIELVGVDDGSTDASADLMRREWEPTGWPLRLVHSGGVGVSQARNQGWLAAASELVAFLDADDLCLPERLEGQATMLSTSPELSHVHGGWQRIDSQGEVITVVAPWREGAGFSIEKAFRHKAVLPSAWMLRKSVLAAVGGFDPGLSQAEDVDLLLRLALAGFRGEWWKHTGTAYRVHPASSSRRPHDQSRGLLWVIHRQLAHLPKDPKLLHFRMEILYTTRAWAGWNAWHQGDSALALELWRTAIGMSPMPPALTWLHLAENVARSAEREGQPFDLSGFLADPTWSSLLGHWLATLHQRSHSIAPLPVNTDSWHRGRMALLRGRLQEGFALWRSDLLERLGPDPSRSRWHPDRLLEAIRPADPLPELRRAVLEWTLALLGFQGDRGAADGLALGLARILWRWACISWREDRRPTARRLEECAAFLPTAQPLQALARMHRQLFPTGAAALDQLADRLDPLAGSALSDLPPGAAFWEAAHHHPDRCHGPACPPCHRKLLVDWRPHPIASHTVLWEPPRRMEPCSGFAGVEVIAGGRIWIRPPLNNPWHTTNSIAVADGDGVLLPRLSRRYPIPWATCPHPPADPEPLPVGDPVHLEGAVLAVADLSAEGYYHWLLELLPRLGMALEALRQDPSLGSFRIWHNGGSSAFVVESLHQVLNLSADQCIDARTCPYICADRLLVPAFAGSFGWPSAPAQDWLRCRFLPHADGVSGRTGAGAGQDRLWLLRSPSSRRLVHGQQECLGALQPLGFRAVDTEGLTIAEQARLLASAECVVSPHGAALANLVFASPGTRVLELHQPAYAPPYFHALTVHRRLLLASCEQPERPAPLYSDLLYEGPIVEPIVLEPETVLGAVDALLRFPVP